MADFIVQATLSNLLVSTFLAVIAWLVQSRYQAASLANLLWILVLIKMVTPPLVSVPVLPVQTVAEAPAAPAPVETSSDAIDPDLFSLDPALLPIADGEIFPTIVPDEPRPLQDSKPIAWSTWLGITWLATSSVLFLVTLFRIARFHIVLRNNIQPATKQLSELAADVSTLIELTRTPDVVLTPANVSPFVWWIGGIPKIVIPDSAVESLSNDDMRMVLAHEMAHIKRHDHWIRWLEWFTLQLLWWNPIMWWARRQLRVTEEIACDALVVKKTSAEHHDYAHSLLNMADILTTSAIRPPAVASAMNSGGLLEKRLKMLIANKTLNVPLWLRSTICAAALAVFPLGLVYAQDVDAIERRLERAVKAGELTIGEAESMLRALDQKADSKQREDDELEDRKRQYEAIANELMREVDRGNLSGEEVELKLHELQLKMFDKMAKHQQDVRDRDKDAEMADLKRQYEAIVDELKRAVDQDKISAVEAELKLQELQMKIFDREVKRQDMRDRDKDAEMADLERQYEAIANELKRAVDQDKLSAEEAELKLQELQKKMFDREVQQQDMRDRQKAEQLKQKYQAIANEFDEGKLSGAEAELKLHELQKKMYDKRAKQQEDLHEKEIRMSDLKRKYASIANDVMREVDRGNLSAEEAELKLHELHQKMFGGQDKQKDKWDQKKAKAELEHVQRLYDQAMDTIRREEDSGPLAAGEVMSRLIKLRSEQYGESEKRKDAKMEALQLEYEAYVGEIKREVDRGNITSEEADLQLQKIRKDMFGKKSKEKSSDKGTAEREYNLLKLHYAEIVQAIEDKVAAGDLPPEDARRKFAELKKKLSAESQQENDRDDARTQVERQILELQKMIQVNQDSLADAERRYKDLLMELKALESKKELIDRSDR